MDYRKVYGGTPVGSESRCDTCAHARVIQGYAESERIVLCGAVEPTMRVPFKVAECSTYEDKRLPCYWQMEKIAWDLRSKSTVHTAGFVRSAADATQNQEQEEEQPQEVPAAAATSK
jgi:hypothetical protein